MAFWVLMVAEFAASMRAFCVLTVALLGDNGNLRVGLQGDITVSSDGERLYRTTNGHRVIFAIVFNESAVCKVGAALVRVADDRCILA
ncbi:Uncharacterised protein [Salmonella enterica]|uniref:Uncharacterized protein n=1 Tax=Salmonella sp. NCTC 6947 TaxID=2583581 RepID=A0A509B1G0_9ENTR|nr:Uncharacterised protein [Salmonella enterica]